LKKSRAEGNLAVRRLLSPPELSPPHLENQNLRGELKDPIREKEKLHMVWMEKEGKGTTTLSTMLHRD